MASPFLGEFLGTMVLVLMGNGVVASVLLKDSKANNAGWIVITAGWAFAVMSGVFTSIAAGGADAHLNPAVSLGFAIISGDYSKLASYIPAQLLGAFLGATLVWLHFFPHWARTEDPALKLGCFSTGPAIRSPFWNLVSEVIGTFVLMLVVFSIFSKAVSGTGPAPALGPLLVGALVWGLGLSLGGTTGYAINPARDLGPRLAHALLPIAGKGDSDWGYAAIPVIGPMLGAALAALLVSGLHL
ncbi:aquaporin family protein [bacterium]|nr:aquaporin family protein [bacterium]